MKKLLLLSLLALLALGVRSQSADKPGNWKLIASDEYPAEDTEIEVQGTFKTYKEKDYDTTFCRLANVDMRVKE